MRPLPTELQQLHQQLGIDSDYGLTPYRPAFAESSQLQSLGVDVFARPLQLAPAAANAWLQLQQAAQQAAIDLVVVSGFRSYRYQADLLHKKLAAGRALSELLQVIAAPGFSEHHTGCALDINTADCDPLETVFETTAAFAWLCDNAPRFGFELSYPRNNAYGFIYEPWHWAWRAGIKALF